MSCLRVVVTGLGCISPVGNTVSDSWTNLLAGKSGIATVTAFDASALSCHFAGEVKGFDITQYIPEKEARHMDRFIHLGLAAAIDAVAMPSRKNKPPASAAISAPVSVACPGSRKPTPNS